MTQNTVNPDGSPVVTPGTVYHPPSEGGGGGGVTPEELAAAVALLQDKATATTDPELQAVVDTINTALATKQSAATAATDAEVTAAMATVQAAADASATGDLQAAVDTINAALAAKQDAATAATDAELAALTIGKEIGYAERTTSDTTTSTPDDTTTLNNNLIAGLSVTVVGIGRPVEVEYYCPLIAHSVAQGVVYGVIMQDGVRLATVPAVAVKANAGQGPMIVKKRLVIPVGVSVTFTVAKTIDVAGTGTYFADGTIQMVQYLSVTQR